MITEEINELMKKWDKFWETSRDAEDGSKLSTWDKSVISKVSYQAGLERGFLAGKSQATKEILEIIETWYQEQSVMYRGKKDDVCEIDKGSVEALKNKIEGDGE